MRRFGGDERALGRTVVIDFVPRQVIGVMPRTFRFLDLSPDVLLPQRFARVNPPFGDFSYSGIARLKPGITIDLANQDATRVLNQIIPEKSARSPSRLPESNFRPRRRDVTGDIGTVLGVVVGALGLVFLLVCANVANLVLVRAQARTQEFAIRAALGAGWGRIARDLLVESLTLGLLGGVFGTALAYGAVRILKMQDSLLFPGWQKSPSTRRLWRSAWHVGRRQSFVRPDCSVQVPHPRQYLQRSRSEHEPRSTASAERAGGCAGCSCFGSAGGKRIIDSDLPRPSRSSPRLQSPRADSNDPYCHTRHTGIGTRASSADASRIVENVSRLPGVEVAAFADGLAMDADYRNGNLIAVEDRFVPGQPPPNRRVKYVSPGLFAAQGTRLLAGRDFTWDMSNRRLVAIVLGKHGAENWGESNAALGKWLGSPGTWSEVVGVVEDVHDDGAHRPAPPIVYFRTGVHAPWSQIDHHRFAAASLWLSEAAEQIQRAFSGKSPRRSMQ